MLNSMASKRCHDGKLMEGRVWEPSEQTGRVMLVPEDALGEACTYAIANPIAAGLKGACLKE